MSISTHSGGLVVWGRPVLQRVVDVPSNILPMSLIVSEAVVPGLVAHPLRP
jgi:hypothetical protein